MKVVLILLIELAIGKLLGVYEISRHGARAPIKSFTWDKSDWEVGASELTRYGITQQYIIGKELHERYIIKEGLISNRFNLTEVYVRTTDYSRASMSAYAQLHGLFPNGPNLTSEYTKTHSLPPFTVKNSEKIIKELGDSALPFRYQPVPVDMFNSTEDHMLVGYTNCKKAMDLAIAYKSTEDFKTAASRYESELKDIVREKFGLNSYSIEDSYWIADTLASIDAHGFNISKYVDQETFEKFMSLQAYYNSFAFEQEIVMPLVASGLFSEIVTGFSGLISGENTRKFNLFISHDCALIGFLKALKAWDGKNPAFSSVIVFELHEKAGNNVINMFYNDQPVLINDVCDYECLFDDFAEYVESWAIDASEECEK